jgi:Fe-S cluster biogenesis protein NfuA
MIPLEIIIEATPNPQAYKFQANRWLIDLPGVYYIPTTANPPELIRKLFDNFSIQSIWVAANFITINKQLTVEWAEIAPSIRQLLLETVSALPPDYFSSLMAELPVFSHEAAQLAGLFAEKILVATAQHGGAILFEGLTDQTVQLKVRGACDGCPYLRETVEKGIKYHLSRQPIPVSMIEIQAGI